MKDFLPLLRKIEKLDEVQRIIPGRVARSQWGSGFLHFTLSYPTEAGLKYMMKKWGTAQEVFILCAENEKESIIENILALTR